LESVQSAPDAVLSEDRLTDEAFVIAD